MIRKHYETGIELFSKQHHRNRRTFDKTPIHCALSNHTEDGNNARSSLSLSRLARLRF